MMYAHNGMDGGGIFDRARSFWHFCRLRMLSGVLVILLVCGMVQRGMAVEEFERVTILVWDNQSNKHMPVLTIQTEDNTVRLSFVNMSRHASDIVLSVKDEGDNRTRLLNVSRGRFAPIEIDKLNIDERRLLFEVPRNFVEQEGMNEGIGVPRMEDGEMYLGAEMIEKDGTKSYIRKVYTDNFDDRAMHLSRLIMHLVEKSKFVPYEEPGTRRMKPEGQ